MVKKMLDSESPLMENTPENENLMEDMPESGNLFDEQGKLRRQNLSNGVFVLRFTPDNNLVFTWIPDDPSQESVVQMSQPIPQPDPNNPAGAGLPEYLRCLGQNLPDDISKEEAIEKGLKIVLKCSPKLLE